MAVLLTVQNNTFPMVITLQRNSTNVPMTNVTSVDLRIKKDSDGTVTNSGHQNTTISDAQNSQITYYPNSADFEDVGRYLCEAKLTYNDGKTDILHDQLVVVVREKYQ